MTAEVIEGAAVELVPEVRAVAVVQQPGQVLVTESAGPAEMVATATLLANVLKDIVDQRHLYADIRGKRYPTVEAWMTIARLDNVVAREPHPPIRHEDGSYEAFAELIRLSDGMVIGAASALCGTADDVAGRQDWSKQSEPSRRSMAQTRATSRAFRQQYSWIMALAGYQPTPAEEMPTGGGDEPAPATDENGQTGTAKRTDKQTSDFNLRYSEDSAHIGFRLSLGGSSFLVEARGPLAEQLAERADAILDATVTVWGKYEPRDFTPKGKAKVEYTVLAAERVRIPGPVDLPIETTEAPSLPMFNGKVENLDDLPF